MKKVFNHVFTEDKVNYRQISRCNDVVLVECIDEKKRKHFEIGKVSIEDGVEYYPEEVIVEPTIIKSRKIYQENVIPIDLKKIKQFNENIFTKSSKEKKTGRKPVTFFMDIPECQFTMKDLASKYNKTSAYIRSIMTARGMLNDLKVVGKISGKRGKPELIYEKMTEDEINQRNNEMEQVAV